MVTETIGNLGLEEGITGWILDARRRFLKPAGTVIPRTIELFIAPVELPRAYDAIAAWETLPYGLDLSAGRRLAANNLHWVELTPEDGLGPPARLAQVDLLAVTSDQGDGQAALAIHRPGICHGLGGWFRASLTETLSLSNAPPLQTPSWRHGFLPLSAPLAVAAGDRLAVTMAVRGNGALWRWRVSRLQADGQAGPDTEQASFHGQLHSLQSLRKGAPGYRPRLQPQGESDRFILERMDGSTTVAEIAAQTAARFPDQFADPVAARRRVRQLARKYSQ